MSQQDRAESILQQLFSLVPASPTLTGLHRSGTGLHRSGLVIPRPGNFLMIPGHREPRWILPQNARQGRQVIAQWRPYGLGSQCKWLLLRFFYRCGWLNYIPGIRALLGQQSSNVATTRQCDSGVPVIYIGTPGAQQKAVVTLVDPDSGHPISVMKVALAEGARQSIRHEAQTLQWLSRQGLTAVPELLHADLTSGLSWQTALPGKLTSRQLTPGHVDWLLTLPRSTPTTIGAQIQQLRQLIEQQGNTLTSSQQSQVNRAMKQLKEEMLIPLILVHGDFAPWNIKHHGANQLAVFDWEDALPKGLPFWDLCHFYLIQAYLFHQPELLEKLLHDRLTTRYREGMGLTVEQQFSLIKLSLLFMVLGKNIAAEYRQFLLQQLIRIMAI